jgi:hypothetical protein
MNQLANEFQKMVLSLMSKSNANLALKPTVGADFDNPSTGIYVTIGPKLSGKCWYYSESDHFQRECPSFRHLVNLGLCHKAANNKVYFSKASAYPNPAVIRYKWCGKLPRLRYMLPLLEDKHGRKIEFGEVPGWDERRRAWFGYEGNASATIACLTSEDWDGPAFDVTFNSAIANAAIAPKATNSSRPMQPAGPPSLGILKKKAVEQASATKTRS